MSEETIPAMRERIDALEKELKTEREAKSTAESKARLFEAKDTFREAGYNPVHAKLYVSANPEGEITQESVSTFADEYNLAPVVAGESSGDDSGESGSSESNDSGGSTSDDGALSALGRAGGRAGDGGQQTAGTEKMTHDEWMALNRKDRVAAEQALAKGLVETRDGNFWSQETLR